MDFNITRWAWLCLRYVVRHNVVALSVAFVKKCVDVRTPLFTTFWTSRYNGITVTFENFYGVFGALFGGDCVEVVACGEGFMYLKSLVRSIYISLHLVKTWYPCSRYGWSGMLLFLLFLDFIPFPLSSPLLFLLSVFSLFLRDDTKWPNGLTCRKTPTQTINRCNPFARKLCKNNDQPYLFHCINVCRVPQKIIEHSA